MIPSVKKSVLNFVWPTNWCGLHRQYMNFGEMDLIAALLREVEAKSVVEIGCRDGRTACLLLHNVSSLQHYVGIDVESGYVPSLSHQSSEMHPDPGHLARHDPRFDIIIRPRGSLDLGPQDLPLVDATFIDGDHSERVVAHDSALARAITKRNGVIVWHDYNNSNVGVQPVLDRLADEGWPIKHIAGTWLAYMKVEPDAV